MNKVSVIIPCYNVAAYLDRCVQSILQQTYRELEIILVDDGSTDTTGEKCEQLSTIDERIRVVHKENGGLSDARNAGINVACGDFYTFVDGDDYLDTDAIALMMEYMKYPEVSLVSAGFTVENIDGSTHISMNPETVTITREEALINLLGPVRTIKQSSCSKLFRKFLFGNLRYKKGIINEDMELLPRILDLCDRVVLLDRPVYHYIRRAGSITESEFSMWKYEGSRIAYDTLRFCKNKYPRLVPYAHFYIMDSLFKMLNELTGCRNRKAFRKQEKTLRFGIVKEYFYCARQRQIMDECGGAIRNMTTNALCGGEMMKGLVRFKHRIFGEKERKS